MLSRRKPPPHAFPGAVRHHDRMQDDPSTDWRPLWHSLHEVIGGKWTLHVLRALEAGEYGFNDLQRELDGVTAKTLSRRLRELRCRGFVEKEVLATSPPATRYRLTDAGREFAALLGEAENLARLTDCDGDRCAGVWPADAPADADCACTC